MKSRLYINSASYGRDIEIRILSLNLAGDVDGEARPAVFDAVDPNAGEIFRAPAVVVRKDTAQDMMDQLWAMGFRPERGETNDGQLRATALHLLDMRALAFAKLGVERP